MLLGSSSGEKESRVAVAGRPGRESPRRWNEGRTEGLGGNLR